MMIKRAVIVKAAAAVAGDDDAAVVIPSCTPVLAVCALGWRETRSHLETDRDRSSFWLDQVQNQFFLDQKRKKENEEKKACWIKSPNDVFVFDFAPSLLSPSPKPGNDSLNTQTNRRNMVDTFSYKQSKAGFIL